MLFQNKRLLAVALSLAVVLATTGFDASGLAASKLEQQYSHSWWMVKNHTPYKPGPNLRLVAQQSGHRASEMSLRQGLKKLTRLTEPQRAAVNAVPASGLARCIINAESTNNPRASNSSGHSGLAGWSATIWARDGGLRFAPTPTQASYGEQVQVLNTGLANHGCGDWCPYDGC